MTQRLRITFRRGEKLKYLSHLEMMRMWERALRRAGWRLAYSQGFNPHPRVSFALPLAVGVASEAELVEIHLEEPLTPERALEELARQMPPTGDVLAVEEVPLEAPPIQRNLVAARYVALCPAGVSLGLVCQGVDRVLAADSLSRSRSKDGKVVSYDLRPLIRSLEAEAIPKGGGAVVRMELRTDARGAGRPDEVLRALEIDPADCKITRTRLVFE